jgi:predicted protein tyrosine phosphatase
MIAKVIFVGRTTAEQCGPYQDWAVISIGEPAASDGSPKIQDGWHEVLRLFFHDIDTEQHTAPNGPYVLMSEIDARDIVEFVDRVAPTIDVLMIHCRAGISRSAAVAKWVARRYSLAFNNRYRLYNHHVLRL